MTLTESAYWTRRIGVMSIFALFILIGAIFLILNLSQEEIPVEYLTPNFACTDYKEEFIEHQLQIPTLTLQSGSELIYEIETETGRVDSLPRVINMYKYNNPGQSLNSQNEAKIIAESFGFDPELIQRRGLAEYIWESEQRNQRLVVQARNLNFALSTDFTQPTALPTDTTLPSDDEAASQAKRVLNQSGVLPEDYSNEKPGITYISIQPDGTFSLAPSKSEADLLRVDFYRSKPMITIRSDITGAEQMKETLEERLFDSTTESIFINSEKVEVYNFSTAIINLDTQKSNIAVYIGPIHDEGSDTALRSLYGIEYSNWVVEQFPCGTYELISPSIAIDTVQEGRGSLVYLNDRNGDTVIPYQPKQVSKFTIFNVTLGYYDGPTEQEFLQPVYIVSGEATFPDSSIGQFHYYVPAINYDGVQNKIIEEPTNEVEETQEPIL